MPKEAMLIHANVIMLMNVALTFAIKIVVSHLVLQNKRKVVMMTIAIVIMIVSVALATAMKTQINTQLIA
jgi:hypothetical protein